MRRDTIGILVTISRARKVNIAVESQLMKTNKKAALVLQFATERP
jgi:hypothetical protein